MKTLLDIPYDQKEEAKRLGAKFDSAASTWYCPDGCDLAKFAKWLPPKWKKIYNELDKVGKHAARSRRRSRAAG